jgi:hypothetical protein
MATLAVNAVRSGSPIMYGAAKSLPTIIARDVLAQSPYKVTMPPGFTASVGKLETFELPHKPSASLSDQAMAKAMVKAWRRDGILQIAMSPFQQQIYTQANKASRSFFKKTPLQKQACVNDSSYAGYIASGEEITGGIADYSEIFTVTKDLRPTDPRVLARWPCHGPCPWLDQDLKRSMTEYMADLGSCGERILQLIELGLDVPPGSLTRYTHDGWHHMRVLRCVVRAYSALGDMCIYAGLTDSRRALDSPPDMAPTGRAKLAGESGPTRTMGCW